MQRRLGILAGLLVVCGGLVIVLSGASPARASATLTVTTTQDVLNGNDGLCSLREAIIAANTDTASGAAVGECPAGNGADAITFAPAITGFIPLSSALPTITDTVTVIGPGADVLLIDHNANVSSWALGFDGAGKQFAVFGLTIRGNDLSGGIRVLRGAVAISSTVITNHRTQGGVSVGSEGILTLYDSTIKNNNAPGAAGVHNVGGVVTIINSRIHSNGAGFSGAGILNTGQTSLVNSSIYSNSVGGGFGNSFGAGIYNSGVMTVTNSTIAGNQAIDPNALGYGGGIYISGTLTLLNSTVAGNAANGGGGGLYVAGGTILVRNSILAQSAAGGDCSLSNGTITDGGFNLVEDNSCNFTGGSPPLLGSLQDNGGPTWTHALLPGSPAIDAGNPAGCTDSAGNPLTTDQRGFVRPYNGRCDIGAFEFGASAPPPALLRLFLPLVQRSP